MRKINLAGPISFLAIFFLCVAPCGLMSMMVPILWKGPNVIERQIPSPNGDWRIEMYQRDTPLGATTPLVRHLRLERGPEIARVIRGYDLRLTWKGPDHLHVHYAQGELRDFRDRVSHRGRLLKITYSRD